MSWRAFLGRRLREVRLNVCAKSQSSAGLRRYVEQNYTDLKTLNPNLPFLVRAADDITPNIVATYDFGVKELVDVGNMSESEIDGVLKALVEKGNELKPKFDELKSLAQQINVAEVANLDSSELVEQYTAVRLGLEEC